MTEQMTGAQAVVAQLAAEGARVILSIPGVHTLPICDAVLDYPQLRFIHGRHEQGIAFMADGYARASGEIAVPLVITGPGVTNSLTALADAYLDSVPMVLLASTVDPGRADKGAFHALKDQTGALAAICKWNTRVERVEDVPDAIRAAFLQAYAGRPGPTAVEIPVGVQREEGAVEVYPSARPPHQRAGPEAVRQAARLLATARAPLLFVGRGAAISGASDELLQLIEQLDAPCYTTPLAKGVVPEDHPLCLSWGGVRNGLVRAFLEEADVVLVIGSSLDEADGERYGFAFAKQLIQIDTCAEMIGRTHPVQVPLVGDAKTVLAQLLAQLGEVEGRPSPTHDGTAHDGTARRIATEREQTLAEMEPRRIWQYIHAIEGALPRDAFVANDGSRVNSWANSFLRRYLPNTYAVTRNTAALGFALPAAIGAKIAHPDRGALAIMGDGGFLFTAFSLATAVQHRIGAVAIVFNDRAYGTIQRIQERQYGRVIGAALSNPDFPALAQAFGGHGQRVDSPAALQDALAAAWGHDLPTVIEVPLEGNVGFA